MQITDDLPRPLHPYYMNFHSSLAEVDETGKRRLGNTLILGQAGTGKTVLLGHLMAQAFDSPQ